MRRATILIAGAVMAALTGSPAKAEFQVTYSTLFSSGNSFVYDLSFNNSLDTGTGQPAQRIDPYTSSQTSGTVPRGTNPGSFATIYDFVGPITATLNPAYAGLFQVVTNPVGLTPTRTVPDDDSGLTNVTILYKGPSNDAPAGIVFGALLVVTVSNGNTGINSDGTYTSEVTKNAGLSAGKVVEAISSTTVNSAVPEPGSLALIGIGLAGLGVYRRRRASK
jgi:hypothetical protein